MVLTDDLSEDRCIGYVIIEQLCFVSLSPKTNRFHFAIRLFSNRSQKTSEYGKNFGDTLALWLMCHFLFVPHVNIICDILLYRCMTEWNLYVIWRLHLLTQTNLLTGNTIQRKKVMDKSTDFY